MSGNIKWVVAQSLIGGMPIGFEKAFDCPPIAIITAGFPHDLHYIKYMNETRKLNIPIINMNTDYETFQSEADKKLYNKLIKNIDILMHVAVCAGLSMLNCNNDKNSSKRRCDPDNEQNQNMYNLTKLGMRMGAKVVSFENAPAAYTKSGQKTIDRLFEIASGFNYSMQLIKTNTILHGIPQSRLRTFINFYKDSNPVFFNFENLEFKELTEYLKLVNEKMIHYNEIIDPNIKDGLYEFILNYTKSKTFLEAMKKIDPKTKTDTCLGLINKIGWEKGIEYMNKKINETQDKKYQTALKTLIHCKEKTDVNLGFWDSSTYVANDGKFINAVITKNFHRTLHPLEDRALNIREMMHLMGLPNDFEMINSKRNWPHITQNVPVNTAAYIAKQIKLYLENKLRIANEKFIKQNNIKQKIDVGTYQSEDW